MTSESGKLREKSDVIAAHGVASSNRHDPPVNLDTVEVAVRVFGVVAPLDA